jgi:hypothetical protein
MKFALLLIVPTIAIAFPLSTIAQSSQQQSPTDEKTMQSLANLPPPQKSLAHFRHAVTVAAPPRAGAASSADFQPPVKSFTRSAPDGPTKAAAAAVIPSDNHKNAEVVLTLNQVPIIGHGYDWEW